MRADRIHAGVTQLQVHRDAVGHVEIRILAGLLDLADEVAGVALGLELRRDVHVEHHDHVVGAQRLARLTLLGLEVQLELLGRERVPRHRNRAVILEGPVARAHGVQDVLHRLAELGAQRAAVGTQDEVAMRLQVVAELHTLHVDLARDEVREILQRRRGLAGQRDGRERQARTQAVLLAQGEGGRAGVAHAVHARHEIVIGGQRVERRPVGQVHALLAREAHVDLFGDHRQQRRGDLADRDEHAVQRVVGVLLDARVVAPEALT